MFTVRFSSLIWFLAGVWAFFGQISLAADPKNPGILEIKDPEKYSQVVAVSDMHAHLEEARDLLMAYGIIDANGKWAAGNSLFIVVGDTLNKGRKSVKLLDFWIRLQREAELAGGKLVHTLGNHEAGLLARDESFFLQHPELAEDLDANDLTLDQFLHRGGKRGRFLHSMPAGVRVGNVFFVHAGRLDDMTWESYVRRTREELRAGNYDSKFLMGKDSLLNAEHWADDPGLLEELGKRMRKMGITSIVMGHDSAAFGEEHRTTIRALEFPEGAHRPQMVVKIDTGVGKDISAGRLLFFDKPSEMNWQTPPNSLHYTSAKLRNLKSLEPCERLYYEIFGE